MYRDVMQQLPYEFGMCTYIPHTVMDSVDIHMHIFKTTSGSLNTAQHCAYIQDSTTVL